MLGPAAATMLVSIAACGEAAPDLVDETRMAMGSDVAHFAVWTAETAAARTAIDGAFAEFSHRLDNALSVWRAESDVQRLNAAAGGGDAPWPSDPTCCPLRRKPAA